MITEPPKKWKKHRFHWLYAERSSCPSFAEWHSLEQKWVTVGESHFVSPEEIFIRGWRYYCPFYPPKKKEAEKLLKKKVINVWEIDYGY